MHISVEDKVNFVDVLENLSLFVIVRTEVQKFLDDQKRTIEERVSKMLNFKNEMKKGEQVDTFSSRAVKNKKERRLKSFSYTKKESTEARTKIKMALSASFNASVNEEDKQDGALSRITESAAENPASVVKSENASVIRYPDLEEIEDSYSIKQEGAQE